MISKEAINRLKSQKMFNKLQRTFKAKGFELYNPYQGGCVKWMNERETNKEMFHPGGILADEWDWARQFKHWLQFGKSC